MANFLKKAREGRERALQAREENRNAGSAAEAPDGRTFVKPTRDETLPLFQSSRRDVAAPEAKTQRRTSKVSKRGKAAIQALKTAKNTSRYLH